MTVKELLRFCSISLVPWLILHSRSLSRYIEFQTWILSQARARERRDEEVVEKGVELTQSPVSPETRGWEKERKLREGTAASAGEPASFYRARDSFCSTPVLHFTVCIHPFARRKSPGTRLLCATMTRLPFERCSFSLPLVRSPCLKGSNSRFARWKFGGGVERIGGRKNETREGTVEINGFLQLRMRGIDFAPRNKWSTKERKGIPWRVSEASDWFIGWKCVYRVGGHLR